MLQTFFIKLITKYEWKIIHKYVFTVCQKQLKRMKNCQNEKYES